MMPIRNRRRRGFLSTPSARRATGTVDDADFLKVFLSTPSARRATKPAVVDVLSQRFLSTPSARRATRFLPVPCWAKAYFYPRPPRGGRPNSRSFLSSRRRFLSTPSARRATAAHVAMQDKLAISIHALREEGDPEGWEDSHHD